MPKRLQLCSDYSSLPNVLEANVSAEELYSDRRAARRIDDPYATRPLPVLEMTDHTAELPRQRGLPAPARAARRPPPRRRAAAVLYLALSVLVLLAVGAGGGLYYLDRQYQGKIYPNVTVQGLNIGELSPA